MKLRIYAIRDRATDSFNTPQFQLADQQAVRTFTEVINDEAKENFANKYPDDYDLFKLGEFDTSTGTFETHTPEQLAIGKSLIKPKA